MIDSVLRTSTRADVVVYLDEDQESLYRGTDRRAKLVVGKRHGQCVALNSIHAGFPGYLAYGAATDDCEFMAPGWDQWVIQTTHGFRGGVGAMAPAHEHPQRMDFPWFTDKWIQALGLFVPLGTEHFYWDVALEVIGEFTQIAYATPEQFLIRHDHLEPREGVPDNRHDMKTEISLHFFKMAQDARFTCAWLATERRGAIAKLREAMNG
jgi:hypothetical protein